MQYLFHKTLPDKLTMQDIKKILNLQMQKMVHNHFSVVCRKIIQSNYLSSTIFLFSTEIV